MVTLLTKHEGTDCESRSKVDDDADDHWVASSSRCLLRPFDDHLDRPLPMKLRLQERLCTDLKCARNLGSRQSRSYSSGDIYQGSNVGLGGISVAAQVIGGATSSLCARAQSPTRYSCCP